MPEAWKQWEGKTVDGKYPLLQYLGGSHHSGVFLTERREGENAQKAAIKLIPVVEGSESEEFQFSRWRLASGLSHPHLIRLFEMGRCAIVNVPLIYVVMEYADENLAQVLSRRALDADETRAMLEPVLDVLAYLHEKGYVHGAIKPTNILADGELLKVSSDTLRRKGETVGGSAGSGAYNPPEYARGVIPGTEAFTPAGDVWSLGMTLVEALTQKLLSPSQALPEPFGDIVRHCLVRYPQGRWTIAEIVARLQNRAPSPQPFTPVPRPEPAEHPQNTRALVKRRRYLIPITLGFIVVAVLAGVRQLLRPSGTAQPPAAAVEQPSIQTEQKQVQPESQKIASKSNVAENRKDSTASAPVPASARPEALPSGEGVANAKVATAPPGRGEVLQKVLPNVPPSARDTIRGIVRVGLKIDVDREGNVEGAELVSPGPSAYFARLALEAARRWKFVPPKVDGAGVLSTWTVRFEFTPDGTTAVPKQEIP